MEIINLTINAIRQIQQPEHFKTKKGFITAFQAKLTQQMRDTSLFPQGAKLEILKQKSNSDHQGFELLSGLVIHAPFKDATENTNENNYVFIAFNYGGNSEKVKNNFYTLDQMAERLNYKTGILINIGRYPDTYLWTYSGNYKDRVHELSIDFEIDSNHIQHTFFTEKGIISIKA